MIKVAGTRGNVAQKSHLVLSDGELYFFLATNVSQRKELEKER